MMTTIATISRVPKANFINNGMDACSRTGVAKGAAGSGVLVMETGDPVVVSGAFPLSPGLSGSGLFAHGGTLLRILCRMVSIYARNAV